jgi:hypothetical protein
LDIPDLEEGKEERIKKSEKTRNEIRNSES